MKKNLTITDRIVNTFLAACFAIAAILVVGLIVLHFKDRTIICDQKVDFSPDSGQVTFYNVYRDGHTEAVAVFDQSSTQASNPLCDPLYSGNAPTATGYDPRDIYATDWLFGSFEYGQGHWHNQSGTITRETTDGIMTVKFTNGVVSWVDADGVIASAKIEYGYGFDDSEFYVAFYEE